MENSWLQSHRWIVWALAGLLPTDLSGVGRVDPEGLQRPGGGSCGLPLPVSSPRARYLVSHGFFKEGEIADICAHHLGVDGKLTTRELAERVMAERGLDVADATLRNSVVFKVVQALRHAKRRRLVRTVEKRKGMCVWAPGDAVTLRVVASTPSSPG